MATTNATKPPAKSAAPKKPGTAVAVKSKAAGNIVSIQDALKAQAAALADRVAPASGNKIRTTQDKKFVLPDGTVTPGPLELVIVDFAGVNNWYDRAFKKGEESPAACYAASTNIKNMVPFANSPVKQNDNCQTCPRNEWPEGGGPKECQNGRLMAVLPPDSDEDTPLWLLQASATAIKGFDSYVSGVARAFQSMPLSVVTTVSFDEGVTYAKLMFSDPKPNPNLAAHFGRQAEATELLLAERDVSGYKPLAPPPSRKGANTRR
jgi:hypothetical protein